MAVCWLHGVAPTFEITVSCVLAQIDQAILRANSSKPGLLGGLFSPRFSEKDPRKRLEIPVLWPTATFGLCWSIRSGPPLMIFSPEAVDQELFLCARKFLTAYTQVDR